MAAEEESHPSTPSDHKDKRTNIPTEELRDFVADGGEAPKIMLYPRDPSLDPQLVWKGKDEQDREDLAVPACPSTSRRRFIPRRSSTTCAAQARQGEARDRQSIDLFADFNGIDDFEERVDFYHHEQNWSNRMILGDSLLVMTSLAEKEGSRARCR